MDQLEVARPRDAVDGCAEGPSDLDGVGTDAAHPIYIAVTGTMTMLVTWLTGYRIFTARRARRVARPRPNHASQKLAATSTTGEAKASGLTPTGDIG